ncbi:MAG: M23 family metallopeptidase [Erysipelotrichia bacterium]|nr:M23 family metallopeptidase [Erysipelotrichia bacterium]NCC55023.1 M23 family metallopeptidase [Erysipelotrichia bacterium]
MKLIKWGVIALFPLFFFMVLLSGSASVKIQGSEGGVCVYSESITENQKLEKKRDYVEKNIVDKSLSNVVLGIYAKEDYKNLKDIINKVNSMYVYVTNNSKQKLNAESYIQAYKYGIEYIQFLLEKKENVSIKMNKEYQEKMNIESEDYQFYLSVLSAINPHCTTSVDGLPVNRPFVITGWFPNYNKDGTGDTHYGIDFGVEIGTDIFSIADGEIIATNSTCAYNDGYIGNRCGEEQGYFGAGNFVYMKTVVDEHEYYIMMCHMKDVNVKKGDMVVKGMKVGTSGNSGNSTGAHLHYEIHKDSKAIGKAEGVINPCDFIEGLCE